MKKNRKIFSGKRLICLAVLALSFTSVGCAVAQRGDLGKTKEAEEKEKKPIVQIFYDPKIGKVVRAEQNKNHDRKMDVWFFYTDGKLERHEEDTDYDGQADIWSYYKDDKIVRQEKDTDRDGKVDLWLFLDEAGVLRERRKDTNKDGKVDLWIYYQNGKVAKQEIDLNHDEKIDRIFFYRDGELTREGENINKDLPPPPEEAEGVFTPSTPLVPQKPIPLDTKDPQWVPYLQQSRDRIMKFWHYPEGAKPGLEGVVDVGFTVEKDGSVNQIEIVTSSGNSLLDHAVVEAIQRASPFQPPPSGVNQKNVRFVGRFVYKR